MRIALISDIHANLEALQTVLADIDRRIDTSKGDKIWSLGDIIGYGPNPVECADLVAKRCEWSLLGNHDFAALYEPTNFNMVAERAAYWTRDQFVAEGERDQAGAVKRWEFLGKLRVRVVEGQFLCVHGTPRRPINEYLFPEDAESSPGKMTSIFERIKSAGVPYCLVGHTHVPGVFTEEGDFFEVNEMEGRRWKFKHKTKLPSPEPSSELSSELSSEPSDEPSPEPSSEPSDDSEGDLAQDNLEPQRVIINPGSVGQPRDKDPRASYAILELEEVQEADGTRRMKPRAVEFFRLEYDVATTRAKIDVVAEQIAANNAESRDETGCLPKLSNAPVEPALGWLDRHIAELQASLEGEKKGSAMHLVKQERIEHCCDLRTEVAQNTAMTTKDLRRMLLDRDHQYKNEMDKYKWLGIRLIEGR